MLSSSAKTFGQLPTCTPSCLWRFASLHGLFQTLPVIANESEDLDSLSQVCLTRVRRSESCRARDLQEHGSTYLKHF